MIEIPKYIKPKLFCSFSGGRTSGYMTYWIKHNLSKTFDIQYVFANTGQEHEKTLDFVNNCDKEWGLNLTWIEPVVHEGKKASTHNIVTYETATRDGSLFENMVKKYGLPNNSFPHCTRELKINPMTSYMRSIGWRSGQYITAIGIRADEADRMDERFEEKLYWYPLIGLEVTKKFVRDWWSVQAFDLEVPEHLGNCTWCWKKSLRKHLTLAKNHPEVFEVPRFLERSYANAGTGGERKMFRAQRTTDDFIEMAKMPFSEFEDKEDPQLDLDLSNGCSESCEVFGAVT